MTVAEQQKAITLDEVKAAIKLLREFHNTSGDLDKVQDYKNGFILIASSELFDDGDDSFQSVICCTGQLLASGGASIAREALSRRSTALMFTHFLANRSDQFVDKAEG